MKHIVNFSGGLCSFWAAKRVVKKYGKDDVVLLFADVMIEDPDLYRFNEQCSDHLGIPITRVSVGLTPWELFRKKKIIANSRFPICSIYLKRQPLDEWRRANALEMDSILYLGFDWTEGVRLESLRREKPHWNIEAPMIEKPLWDKCTMIRETEALGIFIPRAYQLGFPHNNCGMRCVRAGISHFVHLYRVLPDAFLEWEDEELYTQHYLRWHGVENCDFTILKDRRGGVQKSLSLYELRLRIEAGEKFSDTDFGGCGCGAQYEFMSADSAQTVQ